MCPRRLSVLELPSGFSGATERCDGGFWRETTVAVEVLTGDVGHLSVIWLKPGGPAMFWAYFDRTGDAERLEALARAVARAFP